MKNKIWVGFYGLVSVLFAFSVGFECGMRHEDKKWVSGIAQVYNEEARQLSQNQTGLCYKDQEIDCSCGNHLLFTYIEPSYCIVCNKCGRIFSSIGGQE